MSTWGKEREDRLRSHAPSQGRETRIFCSLLPKGERTAPTMQTLATGGFTGSVTINALTTGNTYAVVIGSTTYSTTASATDTVLTVLKRIANSINDSTTHRALNVRKSGTDAVCNILGTATFTLANTGTTTASQVVVGTVSGSDTAIAKNATSITLPFALRGKIAKGQWLQAVDTTGEEYLFEVNADANDGATSLTVKSVHEQIPAGSTVIFPPELSDRREASISESYKAEGFSTFNTGGFEDAVFTTSSAEISLAGIYYEFDAGYRTIVAAAKEGREFYAIQEFGNQKTGYTRASREGVFIVTSFKLPTAVDGLINADFSGKVLTVPISRFSVPEE